NALRAPQGSDPRPHSIASRVSTSHVSKAHPMESSNSSFFLQCAGIGLSRELRSLRGEPGHDIGNILRRHRLTGHVTTPIGRIEPRPPDNPPRAKTRIASESEKRAVHDGTGPPAAAVFAVTRGAVNAIHDRAALRITRGLRRIGRRIRIAQ